VPFIPFDSISRSLHSIFGVTPFRTFRLPIEPGILVGDFTEMPGRIRRAPNARPIPSLADGGLTRHGIIALPLLANLILT
jgi:hypothetical protein